MPRRGVIFRGLNAFLSIFASRVSFLQRRLALNFFLSQVARMHRGESWHREAHGELFETIKLSGQVSIMQSLQGLGFVDNIAPLTSATCGGNFY